MTELFLHPSGTTESAGGGGNRQEQNKGGSNMYKCLSPFAVGVFGRQGELVEIALTHKFRGLEIDITEVLKRAKSSSATQACRYFSSAAMHIGGFALPVRWSGEEAEFRADLAEIGLLLEVCGVLSADRCHTTIAPTCEQRPFHENFRFATERLQEVAEALAAGNVKLGLNFLAGPGERADGGFEFIHQPDPLLLLIQSIQRDNVGLHLDAWDWHVAGGDLEKLRTLRGDQIISVRLSDIPTDADLARITAQERLLPGESGVIDSAAIVALLDEIGFEGPVSAAAGPGLFQGQKRESVVSRTSAALDAVMAAVAGDKPVTAAGS